MFNIYFKKNKLNLTILVFATLSLGLISYFISEKIKTIFNLGLLKDNLDLFEKNFILLLLLLILSFVFQVLMAVLNNKSSFNGYKNINLYCFNKFFCADYNYFVENSSASIWSELNMSSQQVSQFFTSIFFLFSSLFEFIIYFFIIFNINAYASIYTLLTIPLIYIFTFGVKKKMSHYRNKIMENMRNISAVSLESLNNIKNIKAKNKSNFFIKKLEGNHNSFNKAMAKSAFFENYWISISTLINSIAPILVIYLLLKISGVKITNIGDIIVLYSFIPLLLSSFKSLYSYIMNYHISKPYLKKINNFLKLPLENTGNIDIKKFESLKTKNVKVKYDNKLISIPDLSIKSGEKIMLSGESGIGKSTLFNILLGLNTTYSGEILINNINLKKININSIRKIFGISFQNDNVFSLSIKENILLGNENDEYNKIIRITKLEKLLNEKKDDLVHNNNLSGGEKARINIAQNIINNPDLIMIDESLSSVNEELEESILNDLINSYKDKTIICISHRKSSEKYFDKNISLETLSNLA